MLERSRDALQEKAQQSSTKPKSPNENPPEAVVYHCEITSDAAQKKPVGARPSPNGFHVRGKNSFKESA
jgi:hypothetical protein